MRIALDTSVLIAAHISRAGVCAEMLEDVLLHHELVTSEFNLEELGRKLLEKFNFPKREADQVAAFLRRASIVVMPADLPPDVCAEIQQMYRCWVLRLVARAHCSSALTGICSICAALLASPSFVRASIGDAQLNFGEPQFPDPELPVLMGGKTVDLRPAPELSRYFRDEVVREAQVQYVVE